MIRIIKADGEEKQFLAEVEKRAGQVNADVEKTVRAILADVKENGDAAVKSYTAKFDCPNAQYYRVPDEAIQDALTEANENSPEFVNAMLNAVENITAFHNRQKREGFCVTEENGVIMGQRVRGLDRVGLYVPGGTAASKRHSDPNRWIYQLSYLSSMRRNPCRNSQPGSSAS